MVALLTELMEPRADFGGEISPLRTWFKRGFERLDFFGFEMLQTGEKLSVFVFGGLHRTTSTIHRTLFHTIRRIEGFPPALPIT
jgi:hypothetical protein